jgi:hypothetical protein
MGSVGFNFAGQYISGDNAAGLTVNEDQVQHLTPGKHFDLAFIDLAHKGGIGTQKELLPGLPPGIKGTRNLGSTKGTVCQLPAVFTCKGNTLGHALVNNIIAYLGQPVDIGLSCPEIAALYGVIEKPEN